MYSVNGPLWGVTNIRIREAFTDSGMRFVAQSLRSLRVPSEQLNSLQVVQLLHLTFHRLERHNPLALPRSGDEACLFIPEGVLSGGKLAP